MNQPTKASGYFAGLRSTGVPALLAIFGVVAIAGFAVMGGVAASGYNVAQPVGNLLGIRLASAAAPSAERNGTLNGSRVSELPDGRIVVSMDVAGDFKGLMSVWLERSGGSTVTGGDWSLVHAYSEDVGSHNRGEHPEHPEGEAFINKGTLGGSITGGSITFNADGSVASLNSLQLSLTSGSLTYQGASGAGTAQLFNVSDLPNSTGTINLNF